MIKFNDLDLQFADRRELYLENIEYTLTHGEVYRGRHEKNVKNYVSWMYNGEPVVLTNSCTSALTASLMALDLPKNSRVLLPTLTYAASAQAIFAAGLIPTFVDIDESWLLDLDDLDRVYNLYGDEISCVMTVDLYGQGVDLYKLKRWCDDRILKLIVDAAQSFGLCSNKYDQTFADAVCVSFNAYKNVGAHGGGGAIITRKIDIDLLESICINGKSEHGPDGHIDVIGSTFRITSLQCACIHASMRESAKKFKRKTAIIKKYYDAFYKAKIKIPELAFQNNWNWYVMPIVVDDHEKTTAALRDAEIEYSSHYKFPLHLEKFAKQYNNHNCPNAEKLTGRIISLPSHSHLSNKDVNHVIKTVISSL